MAQAEELEQLKSALRSIVVSSSTQVDVRGLMRDYRELMGAPLPITKFGYREPVLFLKERCSDSFVFQGPPSNPVLTLIVPDTLKHIDKFVQKQKVSSKVKFKGKRRSIPLRSPNLIADTFTAKPVEENKTIVESIHVESEPQNKENKNVNNQSEKFASREAVLNFLKRRIPSYTTTLQSQASDDKTSAKGDDDSGRHTSSSSGSSKSAYLEELKVEIKDLIEDYPEGIWCTDLIATYRERFGRELDLSRGGCTGIMGLVRALGAGVRVSQPPGADDCLLRAAAAPPAPPPPRRASAAGSAHRAPAVPSDDDDDALPGIDFDPDVFPEDCMHFMESIPPPPLGGLRAGAMLEVIVGEVYSPSHFWLLRLGDDYNIAMENMMDEMTEYYTFGEGKDRSLALGAVRVGHYCSSVFEGDWHRSLIVKLVDSETVKVRHVDYGTVECVRASALKPLRRAWGALGAQALRARLAGVRPPAAGRRWPHAASAGFLALVQNTRLVANIVAIDAEEEILEVFLIDTSTADDVCLSEALVRAGHADARHESALRVSAEPCPEPCAEPEDARSDVSGSASQLDGRAPRRMPTWAPDDESVVTQASSSVRLTRLRALHSRLNIPIQDEVDVDTPSNLSLCNNQSAFESKSVGNNKINDYKAHINSTPSIQTSCSTDSTVRDVLDDSASEICSVATVTSKLLQKRLALAKVLTGQLTRSTLASKDYEKVPRDISKEVGSDSPTETDIGSNVSSRLLQRKLALAKIMNP